MSAKVKPLNGTPTLYLDGQPAFASYLWASAPVPTGYPSARVAREYARAGIHMHAFDLGSRGASVEWCGPRPGRPEHFDFSTVQARFQHVMDADPEALFHLRVHVEMMPWWQALYPDECELSAAGERLHQSLASTVWRAQVREFLRAYIAHVDAIGLADRVVAYHVLVGSAGEWVKGESSMFSVCGDYSVPMQARFRAWLRRRYADEDALRAGWNDATIAFDSANVPSQAAQLQTTHQTFRDPALEQPVIDYYRSLADLSAELVVDFCHTIKVATQGRALAGLFYGYLMELAWNASFFGAGHESEFATYQRSGHLGLSQVLRSPDVDFIISPYSYGFRGIGGHGAAMPPIDSLRLHGKLYLYEDDTRTHLAPPDAGYGRVRSLSDSEAVLKRNMAEVLTRGMGIWWQGGPYHVNPHYEPALGDLLARFQELGTWAIHLDRAPQAEVAVLLDDESFYYESLYNELDLPLIFQQRLWGLPRMGAPVDTYLLQDLLDGRLPPYKLYVLLNAFRLDDARREALARELRHDGRVALWIYAPGYINEVPALEHMTSLTGMRFGRGEHAWGPMIHITDYEHEITCDLSQDLFWGTNARLAPLFHLEDPTVRALGEVVYSQGRCKPGFGVREYAGWASIYSAAPNLPAGVLRGIARYAGVHLYSEAGDVLYATRHLLGVHTAAGGKRTFALPKRVEVVYDLFGRQVVAQDATQLQATLPPRSTTLYYTGPRALLSRLDKV